MKTLCLYFLAGENVRSLYTHALAALDVDLCLALPGAGSAVNARWVLEAPGPGTRLERVARRMGALPLDRYDRIVLAGFSAGYGAMRELLDEPASADRVDGVVALDAWHDSLSFARLAGLERYARRAFTGDAVLWLAHTDTPTPQTGQGAYASTTQVARELCRRLGVEAPDTPIMGAESRAVALGGLRVEAYNTRPAAQAASEHSQALVGWGPAFLAAAVRRVRELTRERVTPEPVVDPDWLDTLTLGERTLYWIGGELAADPREIPGPKHDMRILSYSKHCRRGGTFGGVSAPGVPVWAGGTPLPLPRDEDAWCAAAASASLLGALKPGEKPPHGLRVSVRELVEDARAGGTLRGADYEPQPGDLAIYARAGGDPMKGGTGHVRMVVGAQPGAAEYLGVGGNEGNKWTWARHPMRPPSWRAWVARG
jgi:hypothetical protein